MWRNRLLSTCVSRGEGSQLLDLTKGRTRTPSPSNDLKKVRGRHQPSPPQPPGAILALEKRIKLKKTCTVTDFLKPLLNTYFNSYTTLLYSFCIVFSNRKNFFPALTHSPGQELPTGRSAPRCSIVFGAGSASAQGRNSV